MIEEAFYTVHVSLYTQVEFSPIERNSKITKDDAIENAKGQLPDGFFEKFEEEGWGVSFNAREEWRYIHTNNKQEVVNV